MARRKIFYAPGEYYHVYNRGCNKENIFKEEENYDYLTRLLNDSLTKHRVAMIAYCLMPNHFHFLMRQDSDVEVAEVMYDVFNRYVKAFNKRYGRTGTLFEERFKVKHVNNDRYLVHLCRYIHRNPFEAGLVQDIRSWKYSDYTEWIDGKKKVGLISELLSGPDDYARFVTEYEISPEDSTVLSGYLFE